jgi:antitoxin component of MazEF toxin-antitoxin module
MIAYEFNTTADNGLIVVPQKYKNKIGSDVRVVVFTKERILPNKSVKRKTLKERLVEFYGENYSPSEIKEEIQEIDWEKPIGEEIW